MIQFHQKNGGGDYGPQRTIARRAFVSGFGFWSGQDVLLEFLPAPEDYGIRFVRTDLAGEPPLPALVDYRIAKPRQTSLADGDLRVDMIEHVMAAFRGLSIDNCQIKIGGPEMPGIDGSAAPFVEAIQEAGIWLQSSPKRIRVLREPIHLAGENWEIEASPSVSGETVFSYELDYSDSTSPHPIGRQAFEVRLTPEIFVREVAGARTFLTESEAEQLLELGLCGRVTSRDVLVFGPNGPIENRLRFDNECARHKVLDMIGDFALADALIVGSFRARRTGHQQNAELLLEVLDRTEIE